MKRFVLMLLSATVLLASELSAQESASSAELSIPLPTAQPSDQNTHPALKLLDLSYQTANGTVSLPGALTEKWNPTSEFHASAPTTDHRTVTLTSTREENGYSLHFS